MPVIKNNKTEAVSKTNISFPDSSAIKAAALRDQQNNNLAESIRFKKDIILSTRIIKLFENKVISWVIIQKEKKLYCKYGISEIWKN